MAIQEWKNIIKNPAEKFQHFEGEDSSLRVWVDVGRSILSDRRTFEQHALVEGTKQHKGIVGCAETISAMCTQARLEEQRQNPAGVFQHLRVKAHSYMCG